MFHTGHSSSVDHRRSSVQANSAGIRVKKAPWSADLGTRWMGGLPAGCGMSRMPMTQAHSLAFLSPVFPHTHELNLRTLMHVRTKPFLTCSPCDC